MELALATVCILTLAISALFIFAPLRHEDSSDQERRDLLAKLRQLLDERSRLLKNLHDLDQDRGISKIDENDYQSLRSNLMRELSIVYSARESLESSHPLLRAIAQDLKERGGAL